ncbi:translation initiation factor IF-3 [Candidatus Parcubacteria bacterium]|nr:MAG: translation initiation factor IF-3 [Candidatus Parcubacteria bacterium]
MKPRYHKRVQSAPKKFYRLNYFIQARELRLLDGNGKQVGIVTKEQALQKAREMGVDVVEIAPKANPPVAKLIDFKKFKYLEAKKTQEEKKKQKNVGVKEIRLRPFIGDHDLEVRTEQAKEFLASGNQVKISIPFRGREITRKEFGFDVMRKFMAELADTKVVREPHFEGRIMVATIAPDKKSKEKDEKHEE